MKPKSVDQYNQRIVLLFLSSFWLLSSQCNAAAANSTQHASHQVISSLFKRQVVHQDEELLFAPSMSSLQHDDSQQVAHYEPLTMATDSQQQDTRQQQRGKRTLYACEEKQLQIDCQLGETIHLIRANYGRFSIQICNEHGQLDWKVNCMSSSSYEIITNSCQAKQSCQLLASNSIFGDSCPGTQKYLEVHYQCVPAQLNNTTINGPKANPGAFTQPGSARGNSSSGNKQPIVIQQAPQQDVTAGPINSETINPNSMRPSGWPPKQQQQATSTGPPLPPWYVGSGVTSSSPSSSLTSTISPTMDPSEAANTNNTAKLPHCPETVWRQIRWPATAAGHSVQMPCPPHAHSGNPNDPYPASLTCTPRGVWASRTQASRCQSIWLRNLTQRLEAGDSPLSILDEIVQRTRPAAPVATPLLAVITNSGWPGATSGGSAAYGPIVQPAALFGDDISQIGRIVRRLVDEMGELMNRISDDKQRHGFAKEMVQLLAELTSNLSHDQQADAWCDLVQFAGERQRISGQLVQSLESAAVLLAGATQQQQQRSAGEPDEQQHQTTTFLRVSENAYVAIKSLTLQRGANTNQTLEVSFPSKTSTLGTKWMDLEQRFTLHLQAASDQPSPRVDVKYFGADSPAQSAEQSATSGQTLKIVFVMIKGLGAHMEPLAAAQTIATATTGATTTSDINQNTMIVNSNLVSLAIVADSRFKSNPLKVDLSAPVELLFRHLDTTGARSSARRQRAGNSRCVYWDTSASDWLTDGCKLIETNITHSLCACNHLTSFALLSERFGPQVGENLAATDIGQQADSPSEPSIIEGSHFQVPQTPRVQLEGIESGQPIHLAPNKALHLSKMLDGYLFGPPAGEQQQQLGPNGLPISQASSNSRLLVYISCMFCAVLLAILLLAALYCRAHMRRLLGSIPAQPPPPVLVASGNTRSQVVGHTLRETSAVNQESSSPTYTSASDYSSALANTKNKLQNGPVCFDSMSPRRPMWSAGTKSPNHCLILRRLQVPIWNLIQLLFLQVLIVILVESQNYLQRSPRRTALLVGPELQWAFSAPEPAPVVMDPIGAMTWYLVLPIYFGIAATTCWLASQLIALNLNLMRHFGPMTSPYKSIHCMGAATASLCSSDSGDSDKNAVAGTTATTTTSSSNGSGGANPTAYGPNRQQQTLIYGGETYLSASGNQHQSSNSPTSSFSSGGQPLNVVDRQHQSALGRLEDSARFYGAPVLMNNHPSKRATGRPTLSQRLLQNSTKLTLFVQYVLPWPLTGLIVYLSMNKSQSINAPYYTTNVFSQISYWPLLVEASSSSLAILLYCGPAICFALALLALSILRTSRRRSQAAQPGGKSAGKQAATGSQLAATSIVNPYGTANGGGNMLVNGLASGDPHALNKQQQQPYEIGQIPSSTAPLWQMGDTKRAKFLCSMLMALVALHSISWISFFAHVHQMLSWPVTSDNYHLLYVFAASNFLLVSLLFWSQRQTLRWASQIAGVSRFLSMACCNCHSMLSGALHSSANSSPSIYHTSRRVRLQRHPAAPLGAHSRSSSSGRLQLHQNQGGIKISPSSHSLFLINSNTNNGAIPSSNNQAREADYRYAGPTYSSGGSSSQVPLHQQQHLYQQLSHEPQQQIYDSTSGLNEHRLNMMQLAHQQQQHPFTLNRSVTSLAQQQQQQHQRQLMTLKPMSSQMMQIQQQDNGQLLVLNANNVIKQQQQQQLACNRQPIVSGEADGPLVAFGSNHLSSNSSGRNDQPASTTTGPNNLHPQPVPTEHRQFSSHQRSVEVANQHQYYSIGQQQQANYADALKTAIVQQSEHPLVGITNSTSLHQFRRDHHQHQQQQRFQQQLMIDRGDRASNNIYDVANYIT